MPSYKLVYFDTAGRGEITRLIFQAAGEKFEDERVKDWPAKKAETPIGQMPYLEVDGVKLPQSITIARFVARKLGLAGKDELEQAKADAIVDTVLDLQQAYAQKVFMIKDEAAKAEAVKAFHAEHVPNHFGRIEKLIGMYGSNGFAVGSSLSWADLFIYDVTNYVLKPEPSLAAPFPGLSASRKSVESHPKVGPYVTGRPASARPASGRPASSKK